MPRRGGGGEPLLTHMGDITGSDTLVLGHQIEGVHLLARAQHRPRSNQVISITMLTLSGACPPRHYPLSQLRTGRPTQRQAVILIPPHLIADTGRRARITTPKVRYPCLRPFLDPGDDVIQRVPWPLGHLLPETLVVLKKGRAVAMRSNCQLT